MGGSVWRSSHPFSSARYFLPFRPIEVSPISIVAFFTSRGVEVLKSEFMWIWVPCVGLAIGMYWWRWRCHASSA